MKLYLRCLRYLKPYMGRVILAVICMVLYASFNVLSLAALKPFIGKALLGEGMVTLKLPLIDLSFTLSRVALLNWLALTIVLLTLLKGLSYFGQSYLTTYAGNRAIIDLRNNLYQHMHSLPLGFFASKKTGKLISRLTSDVGLIRDSLTVIFSNIIRGPLTVAFLLVLLFKLNPRLALISLFAFPLASFPIYRLGKRIKKVSYDKQRRSADAAGIIQESISGINVVKAFGAEKREADRFERAQERIFKLTMKRARTLATSRPLVELIGAMGTALVLLIGGREVIAGKFKIEDFFTFLFALAALYQPIREIAGANNKIQTSLAGAKRVFEIIGVSPEIYEAEGAVELPPFRKEIVFKNVSFSYDNKLVLKNIDFSVKAGEVIAIVGPSGVGKTSLVNLIPRFYDPTSGCVEIDGMDIRKVKLKSLRSQIGIVTQETFLFNDTIRSNIAYGKEGKVSPEEIEEVARVAFAHDFIVRLPRGYDTMVGERGAQLSGGERQRIAIARALLRNPPILILDEATSALDTESEHLVQKALERLMANRTTFVIAHRLSTVRNATRIIVLERGKVVEMGTHDELMAKGRVYRKFYQMQFRERE